MAAPDMDMLDDVGTDSKSEKEKNGKGGKGSGSSKVKDLSHVPCKFFRVGSCTAGSSCPFSHHVLEPGQTKEICAWFVKGNCKFGHKCALAHVLPGQSMSMDRRNKKAAQLAAGQSGGAQKERDRDRDREKDGDRDTSRGERGSKKSSSSSSALAGSTTGAVGAGAGRVSGTPTRNGLLSGSTAPTRVLPTGVRPPLAISKAVPAPAAPAPALKDADFTSFDAFAAKVAAGELASEAHKKLAADHDADASQNNTTSSPANTVSPASHAAAFPVSTPSQPMRFTGRHGSSSSVDFGPVGSPPRASPTNPIRINGFSPGTSPRDAALQSNTQPLAANPTFSAPGPASAQSLFMQFERTTGAGDLKSRSGLATSLGASHTFAVGSLPVLSRNNTSSSMSDSLGAFAEFDDEDMEDFVPSSLKDLLTPEEQSRRMSRTSSAATAAVPGGIATTFSRSGVRPEDSRHRHSRSVPGHSAQDASKIRDIWTPNGDDQIPGQLQRQRLGETEAVFGMPQGLGLPSSFKSNSGLHAGYENDGPSPSMLNPTNASAAFLPGLHHHYQSRTGSNLGGARTTSHGHNTVLHHGLSGIGQGDINGHGQGRGQEYSHDYGHGMSVSPSRLGGAASMSTNAFDAFSSSPSKHAQFPPGRPIPTAAPSFLPASEQHLSPSARALQSHAPGQSLPQGLAAGYSRIHLQPPSSAGPSPAAYSPGSSAGLHVSGAPATSAGGGGGDYVGSPEWLSVTPSKQFRPGSFDQNPSFASASQPAGGAPAEGSSSGSNAGTTGTPEADLVASGRGHTHAHGIGLGHAHAPGSSVAVSVPLSMSRRPSARGWSAHPLSSPLSGPVLTNDDDDLFSMDEEK
ncbi:hypothetical protein DFH11DRAFT_1732770 [Phellopilus nigrolimitatus]|nr:hypothetical protein DFH11DRAFT_1732770 [Phellopilus nigrolimitatus]